MTVAPQSGMGAPNNLAGVYAKLDRARVHARDLNERLRVGLHPDLHEIIREYDGKPSKYVYKATRLPYVDPDWSLVLGDFLTNLRAALDHLACQLVLLDGGVIGDQTQFPIKDSEVNSRGNPARARIKGITRQDIIDAVVSVQPYEVAKRLGGDATNNGLYILNELVKIDKHQLLLEVAPVLNAGKMYWFDNESVTCRVNTRPLQDNDPIAWFDFGDQAADPDFDPHLGLEIRLNAGPAIPAVRVPGLMGLVGRIYSEVENGVLGVAFAGFFGCAPRHWASALAGGLP